MVQKVSDDEFLSAWRMFGSPEKVSKALGMNVRGVYERRKRLEGKLGMPLPSAKDMTNRASVNLPKKGSRHVLQGITGTVLIFSDLHPWPGEPRSPAYEALLILCKELKPAVVIANGDIMDGASISRHPPVGWIDMPSVADELEYCKELMGDIARACPATTKKTVDGGNHDSRFAIRLAMQAPEYVGLHGTDLKHHFPDWAWGWSTEINDQFIAKHRWHGGIHAAHANTLKSGRSMATGHTHRCQVTAFADYNGRRWGIETGTLSDWGPEFDKQTWTEDAPLNWGQGFAVLTFDNRGRLLPPELCEVLDGVAYFRGEAVISKSVKRRKAA